MLARNNGYYQQEQQEPDYLYEQYDSQQVQRRIEDSDAWVDTGIGVGQGVVLAGIQMVTVETLYMFGAVGFFPMVVAAIPVTLAFGTVLNTITIDNGFSVSDLGKFGGGLSRCALLSLSSWKLYSDNKRSHEIAKEGISTIQYQLDKYEGRQQPANYDNLGLIAIVLGLFLAGVVMGGRRK
jgi:hypothetical protein